MSSCMRRLYSSDQSAPGFSLAFLSACGVIGVLPESADLRAPSADLRAPTLSLSVGRGGRGELESFIAGQF